MKTLTITEAKKSLGRWLEAAARGEEIGIISGANIIALRKVEVEATDYARREYGVSAVELSALATETDARYQRSRKNRSLTSVSAEELGKLIG